MLYAIKSIFENFVICSVVEMGFYTILTADV